MAASGAGGESGKDLASNDEAGALDNQNSDKSDDDELSDSEKIKTNLKNSSKTYYSITHTIHEQI